MADQYIIYTSSWLVLQCSMIVNIVFLCVCVCWLFDSWTASILYHVMWHRQPCPKTYQIEAFWPCKAMAAARINRKQHMMTLPFGNATKAPSISQLTTHNMVSLRSLALHPSLPRSLQLTRYMASKGPQALKCSRSLSAVAAIALPLVTEYLYRNAHSLNSNLGTINLPWASTTAGKIAKEETLCLNLKHLFCHLYL